jgi:hypothetical protein
MNSTTQLGSGTDGRSEKVARLWAILEQREHSPPEDTLARDQKIDFRVSMGERELWDRAAQARGVTTSAFVRGVVNRAAEDALAAD